MAATFSSIYLDQRSRFSYLAKKHGFQWWVLWLFSIPAMSSQVLLDKERLGGTTFLWWVAGLITFAVTAMSFGIARSIFNQIQAKSVAFVLITYAVIGELRGLTLFALTQELNLAQTSEIGYRLLVAPFFALVWMSISLVVVGGIREQNQSLSELATERSHLRRRANAANTQLQTLRAEIAGRVTGVVAPALADLNNKLANLGNKAGASEAVAAMQHTVDDIVRPLSHQISTESIAIPPLPETGRKLGRRGLFPKRVKISLYPAWVSLLLLATMIGPTSAFRSLDLALAISFLTAVLMLGLLSIAQVLIGDREFKPTLAVVLYLVIYSWVALVTSVIFEATALEVSRPQSSLIAMLILFVGVNAMAIGMASAYQRYTLERYRITNRSLNLIEQRLSQQAWLEQRRVAALLHGSVQGALYAAAIRLANMKKPNAKEIQETLAEIDQALDEIRAGQDNNFDLVAAFDSYKDLWSDSVVIDVSYSESFLSAVRLNRAAGESILEVLVEACNNAVKHGKATAIQVAVGLADDGLALVSVMNQGSQLGEGERSFGSSLFDQLTFGWSRKNTDAGVEFNAQVVV